MAALHLVTGYKGTAHITSADQGVFNAMIVGTGDYVFTKGKRFEAAIISNNVVRIYDGSLMMNGRQVNLDAGLYLDATIANGTQGVNRHDIIAIRYEVDSTTGVESASLVVEQGANSSGTPTDPDNIYYSVTILNGETVRDMPLYRVVLEGLTITKVEPLFQVLAPMADIQHGFYKQNLLINGDFQCNQRGKKSYNITTLTQYTVDMWRTYMVKVSVLNEGIKLSGQRAEMQGYFTQFVQLGKLKTTTYTISAMADDKICTFTVTPGGSAKEKNFGKFKISALTTSTWDNDLGDYNNKLKINICPIGTDEITFKYIDVFEGSVAYPHVKEDYATALMRCRRYIQRGSCYAPVFSKQGHEDGTAKYRFAISFDPMASAPTLAACSWKYGVPDGSLYTPSGDVDDLTVAAVTTDGRMELLTPFEIPMASSCYCVAVTYVVSCEPLPNGD